jgi:hypothetical protein
MQPEPDVRLPPPFVGSALLAAWEQAAGESPLNRAVGLIARGWPELSAAEIRALNIAARDERLLRLRAASFGPAMALFFACGYCAAAMEITPPVDRLCAVLRGARETADLACHGYAIQVRLADTDDLALVAAEESHAAAQRLLLARCLRATGENGASVPLEALPELVVRAAAAEADALHGSAEILLQLACPTCGAQHAIALDPLSVLWRELRHAAQRLLADVHELAWAYGWSEGAILALSPPRRQAYLAQVRQ